MNNTIKALFLAANPAGADSQKRLDEECREIEARIAAGTRSNSFRLISQWAVRPKDLQEALLRHRPHIVHFSAPRSAAMGIALSDGSGKARALDKQALANLFGVFKSDIRLIVLNACNSTPQVEAFSQIIDFTIGMSDKIKEKTAIAFAASLYQALAFDRSISDAFNLAKNEIQIENLSGASAPRLLVREGADGSKPFLSQLLMDALPVQAR